VSAGSKDNTVKAAAESRREISWMIPARMASSPAFPSP
jgi:hypothetical protein